MRQSVGFSTAPSQTTAASPSGLAAQTRAAVRQAANRRTADRRAADRRAAVRRPVGVVALQCVVASEMGLNALREQGGDEAAGVQSASFIRSQGCTGLAAPVAVYARFPPSKPTYALLCAPCFQ